MIITMVYIVIENGKPYTEAFKTYKNAVAAVKEKYKTLIEDQIREMGDLESIEQIVAYVNVPEQKDVTWLYIEKGINIGIYCIPLED